MEHVIHETAKRLAEAGFPQPTPERGKVWYDVSGDKFQILKVYGKSFSGFYPASLNDFESAIIEETDFFAPTATDILKELPGWSLDFLDGLWRCVSNQSKTEIGLFISFERKNQAEACAAAWFYKNKKP